MGEDDVRTDDVRSILTHFGPRRVFLFVSVVCLVCFVLFGFVGGWLYKLNDNIKLVKSSAWEKKIYRGRSLNIETAFVLNVDEL